MEEERFVLSRENPRNLGFLPERGPGTSSNSNNGKVMPNDLIQKPPPPILDRFRTLLKEREKELSVSVSDEDDIPAPSMEDIVRLYEVVLSELTFNSKPIITELTIIAGEQREYGEGIADAICARVIEVPMEQKLPSLYLLDSIVKNIGREYVRYFASRLPEVFCDAYRQVHPNLCPAMRHLFGTWSAVFPPSVLCKIEAELKFSSVNHPSSGLTVSKSSESPSPRPTHGIHVNPKYLEARRQFEHSTMMLETDCSHNAVHMAAFGGERLETNASVNPTGWSGASPKFHDIQHSRGVSSSLQIYGQKPAIGYGEYDVDHSDVLGTQKLQSPRGSVHTSSVGGVEGLHPSRIGPPRSLSPPTDGFTTDTSPGRFVERASPSHSGIDSRIGRVSDSDGDGERTDWWKGCSSDNHPQVENFGAYLSNGADQQSSRALIDAYGNYRGKNTLNEKPLKVSRLDVNGVNIKTAKRWQNTEEEEYDWEDMSPTLADRSRSNNLMPPNPLLDSFNGRAGLGRSGAASFEHDFRKGNWPQGQLAMNDTAEDGVSVLGFGHGSTTSKKPLSGPATRIESTWIPSSRYRQEPWSLPPHFPHSSQQNLDPNTRPRTGQMSYSAGGMAISAGRKLALQIENFPDTGGQFQRLSSVMSRMGSSSPDSLNVSPMLTLEKHQRQRPHSPTLTQLPWPPVNYHIPHPLPLPPILPQQNQIKSSFDTMDVSKPLLNQVPNKSSMLIGQQVDAFERKAQSSSKLVQLPKQQVGLNSLNQQSQGQAARLQMQLIQSQDDGKRIVPSAASQGGALPPLPPGPPPASSQMEPMSQNLGPIRMQAPTGSAFSGLISSLMAQGLISLTASDSGEDSVGVDFNLDHLKVRRESAIKALYADLPRQCTTCGLRFKCQEQHSIHMDWHVTKNRTSKNRKQKPSRKWFVSTSVWLSGAEALGTDAVPGFLPTEAVVEKTDDEEMAVPADENQNVCALCGEPFDDFYSDETEEWMYKGAVYLNAPHGSTADMDRSQLGPIVHAKCRSESTAVVSPEDFVLHEGGEEGNQRKKMRS